jgi:hypothetical protein
VESTWETRDLPVLEEAVRYFDDADAFRLDIANIVTATGLSADDVNRALRALASARPPLIEGIEIGEATYPIILTGVTERARREVGAWPSPEGLADRVIAAMEQAAEDEPDAEKRGKLRQLASLLGDMGRDILVDVASKALGHATGLG